MLKLQETIFFQTLKQKAGNNFKKLIVLCLVSGLAQGLTVFSILHGLQELMKEGHLLFHQFLFFAIAMIVFYFCFSYVMKQVSLIALTDRKSVGRERVSDPV